MKKFKHVTAVFLALCCTFAVCACAQTQTPPPDDNTVTDTQIDLVKDGATEYFASGIADGIRTVCVAGVG